MSILNVNQIQPVGSGQTVTISAANITASSSTITANTFSGALTGNVTGNVTSSGISTFSDTVNVGAGKSIRLYGATSGYSDIIAAAGSASTTFTLPANGGTSGQYLQTDGSGGLSWQTVTDTGATWTTLSSQSLASSGAVSVTGIPSTATRVMVSFTNVTTATNNDWGIRAGTSSGLVSSGYDTIGGYWGGSNGGTQFNDRWACYGSASTGFDWNGQIIIYKMSGNLWQGFAWFHYNSGGTSRFAHGEVNLGGTLDRIGFTGLGANFNSGTIYPSYMEP